ncbi:olfactory receptor 5B21-like [Gallus gallus]|uniref:olfactory receptor 5B21-like n=1 Tax=Gallus gallus TaxID=9031 RepID=UPI001AE303CA|nr:olfactory receptor 5B21-like [Gallus gallus]
MSRAPGIQMYRLTALPTARELELDGTGLLDQEPQMPNSSSISEFLLLALADTRQLQLLHFWLLLGIYLAALLGNGLISTAVACDHRLHTPMYFFLLNLALLDLGCISTTLPKAMANALWHTRAISYAGCAAQVFFFVFFILAEYYLLMVMAYDRYVAICKPLHYGILLSFRACATMAAAAWGIGLLYSLLHTANTFSLPLCQGNAVDQFFCEIPQILKLSCSDAYYREAGLIMSPTIFSPSLDLVVSVLYSVVPPALNPLIYGMRNQELKGALRKILQHALFHHQKDVHHALKTTKQLGKA